MTLTKSTTQHTKQTRYLRWLAITLFLTFDLIVFGAYVRLTDSGLGCPDWPGCYSKATPWQVLDQIRAEEALRPDGAVTHFKAWVEMIHRYVATFLGILCIGLLAWAVRWRDALPMGWKLSAFTLFWVCLQGAFGMWTVTLKLMPIIVTLHLLGGLTLLALLAWQHVRLSPALGISAASRAQTPWVWMLLAVVVMQIALGGWVSTNYAALACDTVPLCQGAWMPSMDFKNGFALWRDLGETKNGAWLPFPALVAIHWVHRTSALVLLVVAVIVLLKFKRAVELKPYRRGIMAVLTLQIITGLGNVVLNYPLLAAVLHTAGAAALVLILVRLLARLHMAARLQWAP
jgi:cytochrome c oxidase assembly protein subunit 15